MKADHCFWSAFFLKYYFYLELCFLNIMFAEHNYFKTPQICGKMGEMAF